MSEQKYDVFQVVNLIGTKRFQGVFTKSDLSKIMDGAFAKDVSYDDSTEIEMVGEVIDGYWINPLIELVPVEDDE